MLPAALVTVYVVWGSTFLGIRVMVETMPPLLAAGARYTLAGALFWVGVRVFGGREKLRATPRELAGAFLIGILLCFGGNGLVTVAESHDVPSGLGALIFGSVPFWIVVMRRAHDERVAATTLAGVAAGFAGLALLVLPGDRPGDAPLWGVLLCVVGAVFWAAGSFYTPRTVQPRDALVSTAWQMLFGGGAMLVAGALAGETAGLDAGQFSSDSLVAFAYLVVVGTLVGFAAFAWLLRNAPISLVATYTFVNPVVAILLGWWIVDEEVTPSMLVAALLITASVAAVVRRESADRERDGANVAAAGVSRGGRVESP